MLTTISSFITPTFFADYFKDMFVALLVVVYFAVRILTRAHVEELPRDSVMADLKAGDRVESRSRQA